ncbi:hypothetical protein AB6G07_20855 [Providencia stuartii]|uniref:hypothetical protein n=1 Tax=Providencia TaxID=586 RepID=UPI001E637A5E|nr:MULTISPECIES: hypothetical protein [Providencia]WAZ77408.1 hypothetical protein O4001_14320 [Providencia stuartii]WAZ81446.1 hypothetical protein O4002_13690 [Providencia stuartii]
MLNLIVVGNLDYHSFFSDNNGEASFPVSQLFESTPDSLRNKLLPLTRNLSVSSGTAGHFYDRAGV